MSIKRNFLFRSMAEVCIKGLTMVMTVLLARWMGPGEWGGMQFNLALCAIFATLADLGISSLAVREIARANAAEKSLWAEAACLAKACLWLASAILMALMGLAQGPGAGGLFLAAAVLTVALSLSEFNTSLFSSVERLDVDFWFSVFGKALQVAAALAGFKVYGSAQGVLWAMALAAWFSWAAGAVAWLWVFKLKPAWPGRAWPRSRRLLGHLWPFGLVSFLTIIYSKMDSILLQHFLGSEAVGVYQGASKWLENIAFIPAAFVAATLASFSRGSRDSRFSGGVEGRALRLMGGAGALFCVALFSFAPLLADPWLFGSKYLGSVPLLKLLAFACLARFPNYVWNNLLVAQGRQNRVLWGVGLGTLVNLGANYFLIPRFGAGASALAVLATESAIFLSAAWCFRDRISMSQWLKWLGPCLVVAAGCLVLQHFLLSLAGPVLSGLACVACGGLALTAWGVLEPRDWRKLMPAA